jgi:hypothetical protein
MSFNIFNNICYIFKLFPYTSLKSMFHYDTISYYFHTIIYSYALFAFFSPGSTFHCSSHTMHITLCVQYTAHICDMTVYAYCLFCL